MAIIDGNPNFASDDNNDEAPKTIEECLDALSQDIRGIQDKFLKVTPQFFKITSTVMVAAL